MPSHQRVEPGSINLPIADLSKIHCDDPEPKDIEKATQEWVGAFNSAIQNADFAGLADLFVSEGFWRDHLCLAWSCNTFKGAAAMVEFLKKGCRLKSVAVDASSEFRKPVATAFDGKGKIRGVQTFLTTESDVGRGLGVARLVVQEGKLKALTLFTSMRELKGYEEATFGRRPEGVSHGGHPGTTGCGGEL
ncbi:hypothetical protein LSUE1_G002119 [Lachnellula suecica]|uniref:SnoaL-like domain-containing protein n=1 Tax=Lachnellula suecica TaxID=602035 RepID=A0A8T9CCV9_9HELO|nr:hypothetical protein LSUE1_G002119 [Lachnellula suecica]